MNLNHIDNQQSNLAGCTQTAVLCSQNTENQNLGISWPQNLTVVLRFGSFCLHNVWIYSIRVFFQCFFFVCKQTWYTRERRVVHDDMHHIQYRCSVRFQYEPKARNSFYRFCFGFFNYWHFTELQATTNSAHFSQIVPMHTIQSKNTYLFYWTFT